MRPSPTRRVATVAIAVLSAGALSAGFVAAPAEAAPDPTTRLAERLVRQTNVADTNRHLIALQRIADANGGNRARSERRAAVSPGYEKSVDYVAGQLRRPDSTSTTPTSPTGREVELPQTTVNVEGDDYRIDDELQPGDPGRGRHRSAPSRPTPEDATPAARRPISPASDFTGTIALIRRGGCNFASQVGQRGRSRARSPRSSPTTPPVR